MCILLRFLRYVSYRSDETGHVLELLQESYRRRERRIEHYRSTACFVRHLSIIHTIDTL